MSTDYSEKELTAAHATVERWFDAFTESAAFARLNADQQRRACPITDYFTEYCYQYLGLSPADWNVDAVCECCTEVLPRKVSAELSFFESIPPVLNAFFRFLQDQSLHPEGYDMAETVNDLADEIVSAAEDTNNWGPAKHFVMSAQAAGVDVADPAALQEYTLKFNLAQAAQTARFGFAGAPPSSQPFAANPYDPCPCGSGKKFKFCCKQKG